jgi:hypothetical protein
MVLQSGLEIQAQCFLRARQIHYFMPLAEADGNDGTDSFGPDRG